MLDKDFLASRLSIVPGQRTVTLTRPGNANVNESFAEVVKKPVSLRQLSQLAELGVEDVECSFAVPFTAFTTTGLGFKRGDTITDDESVAWNVMYIDKALLESIFHVFCQKRKGQ